MKDRPLTHYLAEIEAYEQCTTSWKETCKLIKKRYKDKRDASKRSDKATKYNVLWSNVQTLIPATYSRDPVVQVLRRFKDKDPVGREASEVLERALEFEKDVHPFGDVMRQCVLDRLLPGRGTAWVRYVPHFEDSEEAPEGITDDADSVLDFEEVIPDYVHVDDFGHNKARTWEETSLVWRIAYMSKAQLDKRFPRKDRKGKDKDIPLDYSPDPDGKQKNRVEKKAAVYEMWDKDTKQVIWLTKSFPSILDRRDDPLKLQNFFPCPKPLFATLDNDDLVPTPDYWEYGDQAQQLDELTVRISLITKAIKVVGAYDSKSPALGRLFTEGTENKMVPVDAWAAFAEKGGIKGSMEFVPLIDLARTLDVLISAREKVKQDLYEITGLSDIIRGSSNANETATAQQIKGRFATLRLSELQTDVQRFARDLIRIMGEIVGNFFDAESLEKMTGKKYLPDIATKESIQQAMQQFEQAKQQYAQMEQQAKQAQQQGAPPAQLPPPPQPPQIPPDQIELLSLPTWEEIMGLLNSKVSRTFRIEIETDSTISMDEDQDKQDRTELLTTFAEFFNKVLPIVQAQPAAAPLVSEIMSFAVRAYPAGRGLEQAVEKYADELANPPPQQSGPSPEVQVEQIKAQTEQTKAQAAQVQGQQEIERSKIDLEKAKVEGENKTRDFQQKAYLIQEDGKLKQMDHTLKMTQIYAQNEAKAQQTAQVTQ